MITRKWKFTSFFPYAVIRWCNLKHFLATGKGQSVCVYLSSLSLCVGNFLEHHVEKWQKAGRVYCICSPIICICSPFRRLANGPQNGDLQMFPIPKTCKWPPKRRFANVPHTKDLQMAPKTEICKCSPFQRLSNVPLPKIGNLQMFPIPEICKWPPKLRFANVPHEQNWEHSFCFIKPYLSYLT